jgi:formate/nitrite transporter FocA (FNT family)
MYIFPLAWLVQTYSMPNMALAPVDTAQAAINLIVVIAGNLVGGSLLVGLTYHVIYRRQPAP